MIMMMMMAMMVMMMMMMMMSDGNYGDVKSTIYNSTCYKNETKMVNYASERVKKWFILIRHCPQKNPIFEFMASV